MSTNISLPTIAFLGIGLVGKPMASRLLQAGYPLTAWHRTLVKAVPLEVLSEVVAVQVAAAVQCADIAITMLEAGPVVRDVLEAAAPAMRPGTLVIDMSSTRQSEALEIHAFLKDFDIALPVAVFQTELRSDQGFCTGDAGRRRQSRTCLAGRPT